MKIRISKKELYEALQNKLIEREEYELCAKMKTTIEKIKNEKDEIYEIDFKDYDKKNK